MKQLMQVMAITKCCHRHLKCLVPSLPTAKRVQEGSQNRFKVSYPNFLQPSVGRDSGYEFNKHRTNIVPHDKDAKIKLCCD